MNCPKFTDFVKFITAVDQAVEIDRQKDKPVRASVWETTAEQIAEAIKLNDASKFIALVDSRALQEKVQRRLDNLSKNTNTSKDFKNLITNDNGIEVGIATFDVIESIIGEVNKARNLGIPVESISSSAGIPNLPLSRLAATIGRKIAYQKGYRFNNKDGKTTPAEVEHMYFQVGRRALSILEKAGYIKIKEGKLIKDYLLEEEIDKKYVDVNNTTTDTVIEINPKKFHIDNNTKKYFFDVIGTDIENTAFGSIREMSQIVYNVSTPATIVFPDTKPIAKSVDLSEKDVVNLPPTVKKARKQLYNTPVYVNTVLHNFFVNLHKEVNNTSKEAIKLIAERLKREPGSFESLFGIKNSDQFSVDKKRSIQGQNLSKKTPINDLGDYYYLLLDEQGNPAPLHMRMFAGRNERLYYDNSVLNAHMSKHMRYALTPGKYTVKRGTEEYSRVLHRIASLLDSDLTIEQIEKSDPKLDKALQLLEDFNNSNNLKNQLINLRKLYRIYPGVDFVSMLIGLQAVSDVRKNGDTVTTELPVTSDATASGGTLTFLQALGTNPNIEEFLQRVSIFDKGDTATKKELNDMYGLMSEAIQNFIDDSLYEGTEQTNIRVLLDTLFNEGKNIRELSKSPTMVFVYGQGKKGAIRTMTTDLADRIFDSLSDNKTKEYLSYILNDPSYKHKKTDEILKEQGLYDRVKQAIVDQGVPAKLYDLLDSAITEQYLEEYKDRSARIFELVEKLPKNIKPKVLPAGAVLDGVNDVNKYGMPLTKEYWVAKKVDGDTVLTKYEKPMKTVADVSTIHSIDAAQMYHTIADMQSNEGVITVHDEAISTPETIKNFEKKYIDVTQDIINSYDIHKQILEALAQEYPNITETAEYKALKRDVEKGMKKKQELANKEFNTETSSIIGEDSAVYERYRKTSKKTNKGKKRTNIISTLKELSSESPIIEQFLKTVNRSKVRSGKTNEYVPEQDVIYINKKDTGRGIGKDLDINDPKDRQMLKEIIEHEIIHGQTVALIENYENPLIGKGVDKTIQRDIAYFKKAIEELKQFYDQLTLKQMDQLGEETLDRIRYIISQPSSSLQVAEFVAIMGSETNTAAEIHSILSQGKISVNFIKRIKTFIKKVVSTFTKLKDEDLQKAINSQKLHHAVLRTIENGKSFREQKYDTVKEILKFTNDKYGVGKVTTSTYSAAVNYLNKAVVRMVIDRLEQQGKPLIGSLHELLKERLPMYYDAVNVIRGIYDSSSALQEIVHMITRENIDKSKKAEILAKYAKLTARHTEIRNTELNKFHKILENVSKQDKDTLRELLNTTPLHDLFAYYGVDADIQTLKSELQKYENSLDSNTKNTIKSLIRLHSGNWDTDKQPSVKVYNLSAVYPNASEDILKYYALKGLEAAGWGNVDSLLSNRELIDLVRDHVVANRINLIKNEGQDYLKDSLMWEVTENIIEKKVITLNELSMYEYGEDTGWKVLRKPTEKTLGIVYREVIDKTYQPGVFTDIHLASTDIDVPKHLKKYANVVETAKGAKLVLNNEEKKRIGIIDNVGTTIVRTNVHNLAIRDSQVIRDELLKNETREVVTKDSQNKLLDKIKSSNIDHPWFLKLDGISYNELDPKIKAKYRPVKGLSNVKNFNENVDLVRKDIGHWLVGGLSKSLTTNPKLQWAIRITKDLVTGSKIGMVILNPLKIARDNISNLSYLSMLGVGPIFIAKNYKNIIKDYEKFRELQQQIVSLTVQAAGRPNNQAIQKKLKKLKKQIKKNPIYGVEERGFINSLGSDLVSRSTETGGGLQKDMQTALEYLLKDKKGNKRYIGHLLVQFQKIGFDGEDFLRYLGNVVNKNKNTEGMKKELDQIADRISRIKTEEDVVNYVLQFTTSPNTEMVRAGTSITDLTDILAKETLYRYLTEMENVSPEQARNQVLDSFPDYKENMPTVIRQLSDMGILLFPSFWMRIQKTIYKLAKNKPISISSELLLEDILNSNIESILNANIVNKATTFGGLIHSPTDTVGVNSVIPQHLF